VELSLERKLLVACARAELAAEDHERIAALAGADLNWDRFVSISYAHGVAPLIYHSLQQSGVTDPIPPGAAKALRDAYCLNAARNTLLYTELGRILTMLRDQNVEVIVLKGAALAETVYAHRALRPMSDIDLLVRSERLAHVEAKLLEMGYGLDTSMKPHHQYHWVFTKNASPKVEIHWHLHRPTDPFSVDIEGCWNRAESAIIGGVDALVFSPADLLLHLCQHFGHHKFGGGIRPLCDISTAANHYADLIDWMEVARISAQWGMNPCAFVVLELARELLEAPIPADFLREIKPVNLNPEVITWARETVLGHGECPLIFPDLVRLFWKGHPIKGRYAIIQRVLSPSTVPEYASDTSTSTKAYVYYPSRIKHLLTEYGPTVARLWAGDQKIRAAAEAEVKQQRLTEWLLEQSSR
jgi:Uncharacterised nucleotidyltransferase